MRGTAWTNVFQTIIFVAFLAFILFFIAHKLGGFSQVNTNVPLQKLWLAGKGPFIWQNWLTRSLLITGLVLAGLPFITMRVMAAESDINIKKMILIYLYAIGFRVFQAFQDTNCTLSKKGLHCEQLSISR